MSNTQAGTFSIESRQVAPGATGTFFRYVCPCGCGVKREVRVAKPFDVGRGGSGIAEWNGDPRFPTIEPSFQPGECGFSGYICNGIWHAYGAPPIAKDCYSAAD